MKDKILLAHGSGGRLAHELIEKILVRPLANPLLSKLDDAAVVDFHGRLAFTTDSYVISPIFFPGGDIGKLAVCGTVNDLAMSGAKPLYLSLSLIIEEGFGLDELERIVSSIRETAAAAEVAIVTGDTKVVPRSSADRLFINTAGVGLVPDGVEISGSRAQPGDAVILSGTIGDHGIAVLSQREGLAFSTTLESDCAPLNSLVATIVAVCPAVRCLRDPTRGGLATTLIELARQSGVSIKIEEDTIRIKPAVLGACELLGLDPLQIANEGKLVAIVPADTASQVVAAMQAHPYGREAAIIGKVAADNPGRVAMKTRLDVYRIIDMLSGDLLPRIC